MNRTTDKDRLIAYARLASKLRMATRITLNQEKAVEAVHEIVSLQIKYETEDETEDELNPYGN